MKYTAKLVGLGAMPQVSAISRFQLPAGVTPAEFQAGIAPHVERAQQIVQQAMAPQGGDAETKCACLLNAIPGLAADEANWTQGHDLCVQDPVNFEAQVRAAGWTPNCGGAGGGSGRVSNLSTAAKVGIGVGAAGVIGAIAFALLR